MLGGNSETIESIESSLNKVIEKIEVIDNELILLFEDKSTLVLRDDGQSCCESRYMNCDDELKDYIKSTKNIE
jgi:hypothetical protein